MRCTIVLFKKKEGEEFGDAVTTINEQSSGKHVQINSQNPCAEEKIHWHPVP